MLSPKHSQFVKRKSLYCDGPDICVGVKVKGRVRYVSVYDAIELVNMPRWLRKYGWLLSDPDALRRLDDLLASRINVLDDVPRRTPVC